MRIPGARSRSIRTVAGACLLLCGSALSAQPDPYPYGRTEPDRVPALGTIVHRPTPATAAPPPPALVALPAIPLGPVLNGKAADLNWKTLRGKVVLLDFFSFSCKPCLKAMPDIVKLQAAHPDRLRVIGYHIGRGGTREVQPLIARFRLNYPLVITPEHEDNKIPVPGETFLAQFGSEMLPCAALIDPAGKLRAWNLTPEQVPARVAELLR